MSYILHVMFKCGGRKADDPAAKTFLVIFGASGATLAMIGVYRYNLGLTQ